MSRWVEEFKQHQFHAAWSQLTDILKISISAEDNNPLSLEEASEISRARKSIEYVRGIVDNLDPEILNPNYLDNLFPYVKQCIAEIGAFISGRRIGHLLNANNNIDQIITLASQSPFLAFGAVKTNLTKAANQYAETMTSVATSHIEIVEKIKTDVEEQKNLIATQMSSTLTQLEGLQARISAVEATFQAQISTFNSTFQNSEIARSQAYETWQSKHQDAIDNYYVEYTTKVSTALMTLSRFQGDAEKVLGTVIDTAQAGAYAKYANEEKISADWFRRLAIASMIAAALVLFAPEFSKWLAAASSYEVDWRRALYRLPFSAILLAPAIYLAKESSKHRINEVLNRRRQHILTTISPYLALLDKDRADDIKAEVAKSIFADSAHSPDEKSLDINAMAVKITELFAALAKRK